MEFAWHKLAKKCTAQAGDGHPVVIFPGLGADGTLVATLREHCRSIGYQVFDWGQGVNTGPEVDFDTWLESLKRKVSDLLSGHEHPATVLGWSQGGLYAREIAKLMAPRLRQVITIGTPFNAESDHTHAGWLVRLLSGSKAVLDPAMSLRLRTPPPLRTTSIYSRTDGVVAWQTCRQARRSKLAHEIEVEESHIGIGWNRAVLDAVSDRLGQAP